MKKKVFQIAAISVFFLGFSLFFRASFVDASSRAATASVTIINPFGTEAFIKAVPEKRVPNIDGHVLNRSSFLTVKIFEVGADRTNLANVVTSTVVETGDDGDYGDNWFLAAFPQGNYDVTAKTNAHLTRLLPNFEIGFIADLDFTEDGANPLKSGDINLVDGDDKVNALDMSILVNHWGENHDRADLNQDNLVNSIDASNLLANFNALGD